jgi:hypothetical protein
MAATKTFNAITSMLNLSISCFNANNAWSVSVGSGILPSRLVNGRKLITKLCVTSLPEPAERRKAACGEGSRRFSARIEVAAHTVSDLDRRLGQIDAAVEEAAKRGRTNAALSAIEGQRRPVRGSSMSAMRRPAAALKAERAQVAAKGRQAETEAAPIRYVAELLGADADAERAIRWLIALMVLCCDPLANRPDRGGFGAAANRRLRPHLVRSTFDSCRADAIEPHSGCGPEQTLPVQR